MLMLFNHQCVAGKARQLGRCLYLFLISALKVGAFCWSLLCFEKNLFCFMYWRLLCFEREFVLFQFLLLSGEPVMYKGMVLGAQRYKDSDLTSSAFRESYSIIQAVRQIPGPAKPKLGTEMLVRWGHCPLSSSGDTTE